MERWRNGVLENWIIGELLEKMCAIDSDLVHIYPLRNLGG